jgi:prepilin-type N-terminal cleavage/methylation domain-containing protein
MQSKVMNRKLNTNIKPQPKDGGFSLIESAFAMVILGGCLAFAIPTIMLSKINSSKSEQKAGALVVSQKIFDSIRGRTFGNIPTADTTINNTILPADQTTALGRNYNVSVRFCETGTANFPTNQCTAEYRQFTITVRDRTGNQTSPNSIIYEMQAAFTSFN